MKRREKIIVFSMLLIVGIAMLVTAVDAEKDYTTVINKDEIIRIDDNDVHTNKTVYKNMDWVQITDDNATIDYEGKTDALNVALFISGAILAMFGILSAFVVLVLNDDDGC